jgi:hypothetical protein
MSVSPVGIGRSGRCANDRRHATGCQDSPTSAASRRNARAGTAAVRVPPDLGAVASRRMGGESEARAPALSARRLASAHACAAPEAYGPAPRPRPGARGPYGALEHQAVEIRGHARGALRPRRRGAGTAEDHRARLEPHERGHRLAGGRRQEERGRTRAGPPRAGSERRRPRGRRRRAQRSGRLSSEAADSYIPSTRRSDATAVSRFFFCRRSRSAAYDSVRITRSNWLR